MLLKRDLEGYPKEKLKGGVKGTGFLIVGPSSSPLQRRERVLKGG